MLKNFQPSFGLIHFHTALLKADQTTWTSCSYNSCLFGAVLPKTSTDQEGKKHDEEENPVHWLARTENGNPSPSAGLFTTKTNNRGTPKLCSLGIYIFTLVFKPNWYFTKSCPVWAAGEAGETNAAVLKTAVVTQTQSDVRHILSLVCWIVTLHFPL